MSAPKPSPPTSPFTLGSTRVNPGANTISGPAGRTTIEPKVMAVLLRLAAEPGQVVSREQFLDEIWSREYGGDESLTRAVSLLRKALGDGRGSKALIETVPRCGYRLLVAPGAADATIPAAPAAADGNPVSPRRRPWVPAFVVIALVAFGAWLAAERFPGRVAESLADSADSAAGNSGTLIAVLPFDSQTQRESDRFLAEGLAEEAISMLTRSESLSVIAANTSFSFRGEDKKDLARLVRQLDVDYVLDGALRRTETGLRLAVHLVDARAGLTTWSDVFQSTENTIYQLPGAVAAAALQSLGRDSAPINARARRTPNPEAYRLYLEAQALLRLHVPLDQVVGILEETIRLDPKFAAAWAELAMTRLYMIMYGAEPQGSGFRNRDPESRLAAARTEAERALALDADLVEARLAREIIDYRARLLPLKEAERRFREVHAQAPENPEVNTRLGMMLMELGRWEEATEYFSQAARLDPLTPAAGGLLIQAFQHTDQTLEAQRFIDAGLCPGYPIGYVKLERSLTIGDFEAARSWLQNVSRLSHFAPHGPFKLIDQENQPRLVDDPLYGLLVRLVDLAESRDPGLDPTLPGDMIAAADQGLILHYYAAALLAAAGVRQPVFELVLDRLAVDDMFFRGLLFRDSLAGLRQEPRTMAWFDASTHLDFWLETGRWPDFCSDPALPYNCAEAALRYRGLAENR